MCVLSDRIIEIEIIKISQFYQPAAVRIEIEMKLEMKYEFDFDFDLGLPTSIKVKECCVILTESERVRASVAFSPLLL